MDPQVIADFIAAPASSMAMPWTVHAVSGPEEVSADELRGHGWHMVS